jgi:hypothetical protein
MKVHRRLCSTVSTTVAATQQQTQQRLRTRKQDLQRTTPHLRQRMQATCLSTKSWTRNNFEWMRRRFLWSVVPDRIASTESAPQHCAAWRKQQRKRKAAAVVVTPCHTTPRAAMLCACYPTTGARH